MSSSDGEIEDDMLTLVEQGLITTLKILLKHGLIKNVNWKCGGTTMLSMAASQGHEDIVSLLLKYGADPNITDDDGNTPMHEIYISNYDAFMRDTDIQILEMLMAAGADPTKLNNDGVSPLTHLARNLRATKIMSAGGISTKSAK